MFNSKEAKHWFKLQVCEAMENLSRIMSKCIRRLTGETEEDCRM